MEWARRPRGALHGGRRQSPSEGAAGGRTGPLHRPSSPPSPSVVLTPVCPAGVSRRGAPSSSPASAGRGGECLEALGRSLRPSPHPAAEAPPRGERSFAALRSQEFRHAPAVPSWGGGAVHAGPAADCPSAARGAGRRACRHVPLGPRRRPGPLAAPAPPRRWPPRAPLSASPPAEEAEEGAAAPSNQRRSSAAPSDVRQGGE